MTSVLMPEIDSAAVQQVYEKSGESFPLPRLSDDLIICGRVFINKGDITAAALVKLTAEGILLLDKTQPRTLKARAVTELIEDLKKDVKRLGLSDCHVFVQDEKFKDFLLKNLDFQPCKSGIPLVWYAR